MWLLGITPLTPHTHTHAPKSRTHACACPSCFVRGLVAVAHPPTAHLTPPTHTAGQHFAPRQPGLDARPLPGQRRRPGNHPARQPRTRRRRQRRRGCGPRRGQRGRGGAARAQQQRQGQPCGPGGRPKRAHCWRHCWQGCGRGDSRGRSRSYRSWGWAPGQPREPRVAVDTQHGCSGSVDAGGAGAVAVILIRASRPHELLSWVGL